MLHWLHKKLKDKDRERCVITVDREAFKKDDPDAPDVLQTPVKIPAFPRRMAMSDAGAWT